MTCSTDAAAELESISLQTDCKSTLNRKLVAVQVRAAALGRQLKNVDLKNVADVISGFNEEWRECFESVSLLHADVLECGVDVENLDKLACRVEDVLFELKEEIFRVKGSKELLPSRDGCSLSSSPGGSINVPVDNVGRDQHHGEGGQAQDNDNPPPLQVLHTNDQDRMPRIVRPESGQDTYPKDCYRPNVPNPHTAPYLGQLSAYPPELYGNLQLPTPPAPKMALENFDGNIMKYWDFKKRFQRHVEKVYPSYEDRMAFLLSSCVGRAHEVIAGIGCLLDSHTAYVKAWERLDRRFGDEKRLAERLRGELLSSSSIKEWDAESLLKLSDKMYQCEVTFEGMGKSWMLNSQELMHELFGKLPHRVKAQFVSASSHDGLSSFSDLRMLVERAASEAESEYGVLLYKPKGVQQAQSKARTFGKSPNVCMGQHSESSQSHPRLTACECCGALHKLWRCRSFEVRSVSDRRLLVQDKGLCFNCLLPGHRASHCKVKVACRKCGRRHNTLLHLESRPEQLARHATVNDDEEEQDSSSAVCAAGCKEVYTSQSTFFKVVPVRVWASNPEEQILTYAFIDEGSNINMCSERLIDKLGIAATATNVRLITSNATTTMSRKVNSLAIQGVGEIECFQVNDAFVVDEVVDVSASIPTNDLVQHYPHLCELSFPSLDEHRIDLLLGCDLHRAFLTKDVLIGNPGLPCGLHTALGWTIYGTDNGGQRLTNQPKLMVNFMNEMRDEDQSCEQLLKIFARDFEDEEEFGNGSSLSQEDKRALYILNSTVKRDDKHFSVGILWKDDSALKSDGRNLAEKRLAGLKKRFHKDPELFQKYSEKMSEYIDKYAEPAPKDTKADNPKRRRYIPDHCTSQASKFRVVFDCSARCEGESLNDKLLQGPDLTNTVIGVLLRFRQHPVAVVADIKGMFSQVLVEEGDREALRFLWYPNNDLNQPPAAYRMRTHVFGARSSPCCAAFALRMTAGENVTNADQSVVNVIMKNIYVDDMCMSCTTEQEACNLVTQLRLLLASGGFHLTKFMSNSKQVLENLPPDDVVVDVNVHDELPLHKTLGVYWDASSDRLKVRVNVKEKPCTRRGLLSMIGQTYDPLGILQPFLLPARHLLQQACDSKLGWDDDIGDIPGLKLNWEKWFETLPELEKVELIRCVLPAGELARIELHIFADASAVGYGACAYLRCVCKDNSVYCRLVMGKSRVTPLKRISIPRLELVAAVLAAKLGNLIKNELDIKIDELCYWTDATVVLRYINNSSTRFETFVANRIELLHTITSVSQWRYVPTDKNPADLASRGVPPKNCVSADMWFNGASFLLCHRTDWPEQPSFLNELNEGDPEIKNSKSCYAQVCNDEEWSRRLFARYSNLAGLQRSVAWMLRFKMFLKWKAGRGQRPPDTRIMAVELDAALQAIVQLVQAQEFSETISVLPNQTDLCGPCVPITEKLLQKSNALKELQSLSPFVVNGVLRVGGRLRYASIPYEVKYPVLLPHRHLFTDLLIKHCHEKEGHLGVNQVLSEMNKRYWIIKGRGTVKRVLDACVPCRFWKAGVGSQQMGDLPPARVRKNPPFTNIGTDLMGPILVTIGRSQVKRYICIFNCLTTRAIHLEVVPSLDASSFLQAYRRFCNRRNVNPTTIYSDNGSNFVAAEKELSGKVTWRFNPPRASHQGGFYEIFFKLFRKIFRNIVSNCTLGEFDLLTYTVEIERILNNRPITRLPDSPDDCSALTPNSILTGSMDEDQPVGKFTKADLFRRSWKKTEYLANKFWTQWTNQYLPLLQPKQKWFGTAPNFEPGALVLMMDESTPRGKWPKAIVTEKLPDQRDLVRRVRVRTSDGSSYMRDIRKLCLLEGQIQ